MGRQATCALEANTGFFWPVPWMAATADQRADRSHREPADGRAREARGGLGSWLLAETARPVRFRAATGSLPLPDANSEAAPLPAEDLAYFSLQIYESELFARVWLAL